MTEQLLLIEEGARVVINDDAFSGLTNFNGMTVSASKNMGASGKTQMFNTPNGGGIYLGRDQFAIKT